MALLYGGDYNPELTDESVWDDDIRLMGEARINLVTLGVFSWGLLEPREGEFEFGWLDRIMDKLDRAGIMVDLATATASPPPWLARRYPESLPVDEHGVVRSPGSRQAYAPTSEAYLRLSRRMAEQMIARYHAHPAVVSWHINNELGCHTALEYGPSAATAFRTWLRARYGTIERLNQVWGTAFWSQRYDDFEEILPPRVAPNWRNPTQLLDFRRFSSDALLQIFLGEKEILRRYDPVAPVLTNFIGAFKPVDYARFAPHVDIVADDSYPDPLDPRAPMHTAFARDLMRSLAGGRPWLLLEQSAGYVNWRPVNATKRADQMAALSMQAVARGADGILFFQIRQSHFGAEKFHSGLLPHSGERSRIWRSVTELGARLETVSAVEGTTERADVAFLFDWENWWAIEEGSKPTPISYYDNVIEWYRPFWERSIPVEIVHPEADLSRYRVVVVPNLYLMSDRARAALATFVEHGGVALVTYFSAIVDEHDVVPQEGYLAGLRSVLGIWIDDFSALSKGDQPGPRSISVLSERLGAFRGTEWAEYLEAETAEVLAVFDGHDLDGVPAVTRNAHGAGSAWYVATLPGADGVDRLLDAVLDDAGVRGEFDAPAGVEVTRRGGHLFVINQSDAAVDVDLGPSDPGAVEPGTTLTRRLRPWEVVVVPPEQPERGPLLVTRRVLEEAAR